MSVDLCIVSYNAKEKLIRLLDTARDCGGNKMYIADNGSTDGSVEWIKSNFDLSHGNIVFNENIGYSAACNQLAAIGTGDIIGLLNCDVWFTPSDVLSIQQTFDDHPEVAILGPKQRDETGHITHAGIFGTESQPKMRGWKIYDPDDSLYRQLEECITVSGSAYFIRRSVWEDLTNCSIYQSLYPNIDGAFLPTKHYFEERGCSAHARGHGYQVWYDGRISFGHSWHASHPIGSPQDMMFQDSKRMYQDFCDIHSIEREL